MDHRPDNLDDHEFRRTEEGRRLRTAIHSRRAPESLRRRVRERLDAADRHARRLGYAGAAAAALLVAGWLESIRITGFPPHELLKHQIYINSLVHDLDQLLAAGLGDHIHCAFFRSFPSSRPSRELVLEELGEDWAPLEPLVQADAPEGFEVRLAHRCDRDGREFLHLALLRDDELMSLLLTEMRSDDVLPGGGEFSLADRENFAIAAFEVAGYAAFVASELAPEQNLAAARRWASPLREFLDPV